MVFQMIQESCQYQKNVLYGNRISINFVGAKFDTFKNIYDLFKKHKTFCDEVYVCDFCWVFQRYHIIDTTFTVCHFQFGDQNRDNLMDYLYLKDYDELSKKVL